MDRSGNERKKFPNFKMFENLIIRNNDKVFREVTRLFCSKIADKLVERADDCQSKKRSLIDTELDDRSGPSKKRSVKRRRLSEIFESPQSPNSCLGTTLDSPVPTTSAEQSLETLVNTEPGMVPSLIGIIQESLEENKKVFSAFYLVDESMVKVRLQIWNRPDTKEKYAALANLKVGQVVSLQNVNFNENKYLTISSAHETKFTIDPDNVRAGELREWFKEGQNNAFETVGQKQM